MPVLVTNCIPVNKAHAIDFEDRFVHRINHVDKAQGFLRNEVLRPSLTTFDHATGRWCVAEQEDPAAVYRIATLWETMDDFVTWTHSPSFALAHAQKTPRDMFTHAPALDIHEVYLTTEDQGSDADSPPRQGVLVTNCIPVDKAHVADFEDRFANRIHLVDKAPGFIRNEAPKQFDHATGKWKDTAGGGVYRISTLWETMQSFIDWTASPGFALAHSQKTPKAMFSGPTVLEIHDVFLSSAGGLTLQSDHYAGGVTQAEPGMLEEIEEETMRAHSDNARTRRVQARMKKLSEQKELDKNGGKNFSPFGSRSKPEVASMRIITAEELSTHVTPETGLYLVAGAERKVFDVTTGKDFYGPGGGYAFFAGRDASRGLAKSSLDPATLDEVPTGSDQLAGLDENEISTLAEWVAKLESKYPVVGILEEAARPAARGVGAPTGAAKL